MKVRMTLAVFAMCVALAAVPAMAGTIYDNGPTNGNTDAWTINFGYVVSDTFNLSGGTTVNGANFAMWLYPGDTLTSADLSITSSEFGGTSYFNSVVNFTQSGCVTNDYGYNLCQESTTLNVALNAGSYWLNLENASVPSGDPVYWDENSGPSHASESSVGTIPSESFTILGGTTTTTTTTSTSTTPEPSSIMLFGSGILGLAGLLRRKLF